MNRDSPGCAKRASPGQTRIFRSALPPTWCCFPRTISTTPQRACSRIRRGPSLDRSRHARPASAVGASPVHEHASTSPYTHRNVRALAAPMILSNVTVPLLGLVDTAVMGHLRRPALSGGRGGRRDHLQLPVHGTQFPPHGHHRTGRTGPRRRRRRPLAWRAGPGPADRAHHCRAVDPRPASARPAGHVADRAGAGGARIRPGPTSRYGYGRRRPRWPILRWSAGLSACRTRARRCT